MRTGNFEFKPKLITTVLTVLLLPVLTGLGIWQLQRAAEKERIVQNQQRMMQAPEVRLKTKITDPAELAFRRIVVTGEYDAEHQIYIDNKVQQGRVGYEIVTPLRIENTDVHVLVNRGWLPMHANNRAILPKSRTPAGTVTVTGIARLDPKDVADFGSGNRSNNGWPAVVRWLDISALQQETGLVLQPFVILQSAEQGSGFVRDWKFINAPPEKSLAYATQWFSFAAILLILYVVLNTRRVNQSSDEQ